MEQNVKVLMLARAQLWVVSASLWVQNITLRMMTALLFRRPKDSKNILVFKIGNIGDVVCAIPSFAAIRRAFPQSRITLLTSPGKRGAIGAREVLAGTRYFDEVRVYYADDIDSAQKRRIFLQDLKVRNYGLFIQLPDDWARWRTLARNLIFAKMIDAGSAFGFRVRTSNLFKKTQVDFLPIQKNEVESLLDILQSSGISAEPVEFALPLPPEAERVAHRELSSAFDLKRDLIVGICPGGKGDAKRWPAERFGEVAKFLSGEYNAKFVIFGGPEDYGMASVIGKAIGEKRRWRSFISSDILKNAAGVQLCRLLLTNDTGLMHIAAALKVPTIALFSIRSVYGKWFPYGRGEHKIIYHRFLPCDYRSRQCIQMSMERISVDEVKRACEEILARN